MRYPPRLLLALAAVAFAAPASAIEEVVVEIDRIEGPGWSLDDLTLRFGFAGDDGLAAKLTAARLALPERLENLSAVSVDCPRAAVTDTGLVCARVELGARGDGVRVGPLPLSAHLDWQGDGRRLRMEGARLAPGPLWALAAGQGLVPALEVSDGEMAFALGLDAEGVRVDVSLSGLDFSDAQGLHAGEDLGAELRWRLSPAPAGWQTRAELELGAGQIYLHPVFVNAGATPLAVTAAGSIDAETGRVHLAPVRVHHRSVASLEGELRMAADGTLEELDVRLGRTALAPVYATYLQPFAIGTLFDAVTVDGELQARLEWQPAPERRRLQIDVDGIDIDDAGGRFNFFGVGGHVDWRAAGGGDATRLSWDGGQLYRIDLGAGVLDGRFVGRRFDLGAPVRVPLLEGAVRVSDLRVDALGTRDLTWQFRGSVEPMSLAALTDALAWPSFGGTLGGDIPLVSYAAGVISVDGSLDVRVFDGAVRIRELRIADPFGVIPVLFADLDVHNLSLDALTGTFSFGNIQGRLQGRVHGLILKDWKPTRFDARFATPEDDDSRHRISQRAVENLASLGGAGAALSSTFMRIFDEFSYRRLGIACRLEGGVCEMDGVAPAESGYYIVEGGGLPPRIDVLGFNRRVDWEVLLGRLRQIVATEGPVIR